MAASGIRVEGLSLLRRNLRSVDKELPKGLKGVHRAVAEPVAERARSQAPSRTGRLAASIRAGGSQRAATITAGARLRPYPYGPIVHYGGYPGDYAGNPFLTDAINEMKDSSLRLYETELNKWLNSVWVDSS